VHHDAGQVVFQVLGLGLLHSMHLNRRPRHHIGLPHPMIVLVLLHSMNWKLHPKNQKLHSMTWELRHQPMIVLVLLHSMNWKLQPRHQMLHSMTWELRPRNP
jgi:hypothetical protein